MRTSTGLNPLSRFRRSDRRDGNPTSGGVHGGRTTIRGTRWQPTNDTESDGRDARNEIPATVLNQLSTSSRARSLDRRSTRVEIVGIFSPSEKTPLQRHLSTLANNNNHKEKKNPFLSRESYYIWRPCKHRPRGLYLRFQPIRMEHPLASRVSASPG